MATKSRTSFRYSAANWPRDSLSISARSASAGRCCIRASSHGTLMSAPRVDPKVIYIRDVEYYVEINYRREDLEYIVRYYARFQHNRSWDTRATDPDIIDLLLSDSKYFPEIRKNQLLINVSDLSNINFLLKYHINYLSNILTLQKDKNS